VFERVTVRGALVVLTNWPGNVREVGLTEMTGAVPDPLRFTTRAGRPLPRVMVSVADLAPIAVGLNLTVTVQKLFARTRPALQLLSVVNSLAFVPETT
jgi:hypothetical protein